jgi:hypothetical protein
MKLVETDSPHGDEEVPEVPRPPRPERRRVYVSLLVTLGVLAATVVAVYLAFPKRNNELVTAALEAHRAGGPYQMERPTPPELKAWTVGVVGGAVPWPAGPEVVGTWQIRILRRPAALVRFAVGGQEVTLMAMRAWDAPPRKYRRRDGDELAISWRRGPWTLVAVGPAAEEARWKASLDVP